MATRKEDIVPLGGSYRKHFDYTKRAITNPYGDNVPSSSSSSVLASPSSLSASSSLSGKYTTTKGNSSLSKSGSSSIPIEQRSTPNSSKLSFAAAFSSKPAPSSLSLPTEESKTRTTEEEKFLSSSSSSSLNSTVPPVIDIPETNPSSMPITTTNSDGTSSSITLPSPTPALVSPSSLPSSSSTSSSVPPKNDVSPSSTPSLREKALEEQVRLLQADYYSIFVKLLESENRSLSAATSSTTVGNDTTTVPPVSLPLPQSVDEPIQVTDPSSTTLPGSHSKRNNRPFSSSQPRSSSNDRFNDGHFHEHNNNASISATSPSVRFAPVYYFPPPIAPSNPTKVTVPSSEPSSSSSSSSSSPTISSSLRPVDPNTNDLIHPHDEDGYMPLTNSAKRLQQKIIELGDRIAHQSTVPVPTFITPSSSPPATDTNASTVVPIPTVTDNTVIPKEEAAADPASSSVTSTATVPVPISVPVPEVSKETPVLTPAATVTVEVSRVPAPSPPPAPTSKHASIFSFISSSLASAKVPKTETSSVVPSTASSSTGNPTETPSSPSSSSVLEQQNQELMETIKILSNRLTEALQLSEVVQAERDAIHATLHNLKKIDRRLSIVLGIRAGAYLSAYRNEKLRTEEANQQCKKALTASEAAIRAQHTALQQLHEKETENEQHKKYIDELETTARNLRTTIDKHQSSYDTLVAERSALKDSLQMYKKMHQQNRIAYSVRLAAALAERDAARTFANECKENETKANAQATASLKSQKVAQQQARHAEEKKNEIEALYNENLTKMVYLTSQNEVAQKKLQQLNDEKTVLHQTLTRMRQVLSHQMLASGIRLSAVRHQLMTEKVTTAKLQDQYTTALNLVQETKEAAKYARTELAKAITVRDTVTEQNTALEGQLAMLQHQYRTSTEQITNLTAEKETLHTSIKLVRKVNRQQYLALGVRTAALLKEKDELQNTLANTRKILQDEKNEVHRLLTSQQNLTATNQELLNENSRLTKDLVTERNQVTTLTTVINSLSKQVENNSNSSAIANAERDALMNTLHHMKKIEHVKEEWGIAAHGVLAKLHKMEEEKAQTVIQSKDGISEGKGSPNKATANTNTNPSTENAKHPHTGDNVSSHGISSWFGGSGSSSTSTGNDHHELQETVKKLKAAEQKVKETETKYNETLHKLQDTEKEVQHMRSTMKNETIARQQVEAERDVLHSTLNAMKAEQHAKSNWTAAVTSVVATISNESSTNDTADKKEKKDKKKKKDKNTEAESVTGNDESSSSSLGAVTTTGSDETAVAVTSDTTALADENNKLKAKLKEKRNELKIAETRIQELEAELARLKGTNETLPDLANQVTELEKLKYDYEQLQLTMNDTSQHLSRKLQEKETELQVSVKRIHQLQLLLDTYAESGPAVNTTDSLNETGLNLNPGEGFLSTTSSIGSSQTTSTAATPTRKQSLAPPSLSSSSIANPNKGISKYPSSSSFTNTNPNRYVPSSSASSTGSSNFLKRALAEPVFVEHAKVNNKQYNTSNELYEELKTLSFTDINSQLILGIDCTKSNLWNGTLSFNGRNLHDVSDPTILNPYQRVISIIGETMSHLDVDNLIPVYGFGDKTSADTSVFSFAENFPNKVCNGFQHVLECYKARIPNVPLAGPTSFAPIIRTAIKHIQESPDSFTILLILADGQVTAVQDTELAIVEASKYPLSIICIGIGDGPWNEMRRFDDGLPKRKFDNFHFVELEAIENLSKDKHQTFRETFVCSTLAEIPSQIAELQRLRMI